MWKWKWSSVTFFNAENRYVLQMDRSLNVNFSNITQNFQMDKSKIKGLI